MNGIKNSQGYSILYVLIAILGLTSLYLNFSHVIKSKLNQKDFVKIQSNSGITVWEIGTILNENKNCLETFKENQIHSIKRKNRLDTFSNHFIINKKITGSNLTIKNYKLLVNKAPGDQNGKLKVTFHSKAANKDVIKKIKMKLSFDDNLKLQECRSIGFDEEATLSEFTEGNSTYEEIFDCIATGQIRFNSTRNTMQVCNLDKVWDNILSICQPGSLIKCPSNANISKKCNEFSFWDLPNIPCEEWENYEF